MKKKFKFRAFLKENLIAGLLIILPIYATVVVLLWLINLLSGLGNLIPNAYHPTNLFPYPGVEFLWNLILTLTLLFLIGLTGLASRNLVFSRLLLLFEKLVEKLPILRSVYSGLRQVLAASLGKNTKDFRRVVLVQWPQKGSWTIAFVTNSKPPSSIVPADSPPLLSVYVPTTPNPTGGYWILVPEAETRPCSLSVEEAFKIILSLGIVQKSHE